MTRLALILIAVLALAPAPSEAPRSPPRGKRATAARLRQTPAVSRNADRASGKGVDRRALMRSKLAHAQGILEGVTLNDFDSISRHAGALAAAADDPLWQSLQRPAYRIYQSEFEQIISAIAKAAQDQNSDAAALGYVRLAMNCVRCHQSVRGVSALKAH